MAEAGLVAAGVSLAHAGTPVLREVTLTLRPGEVLVLAGPNGAGKSSLLACLGGAIRPGAGTARLDGHDPARLPPAHLAQLRAVLDQNPEGAGDFTAAQLAGLGLSGDLAPGPAGRLVAKALALVDMTLLADLPLARLSGGQRQRAHLARVLVQILDGRRLGGGHYLLLDEPTASLDPGHQATVLRAVRQVAAAGTGVLVVLHDLTLAAAMADRVGLMDRGRLIALGPPGAILTADRLSALYGLHIAALPTPWGGLALVPQFGDWQDRGRPQPAIWPIRQTW